MKLTDMEVLKAKPFLTMFDWEKDVHNSDDYIFAFHQGKELTKSELKDLPVGAKIQIPMCGELQGEMWNHTVTWQGKFDTSNDMTVLMHDTIPLIK